MIKILFVVFWILGLLIGGYRNREDAYLLGGFGITWLLFALLALYIFFDVK